MRISSHGQLHLGHLPSNIGSLCESGRRICESKSCRRIYLLHGICTSRYRTWQARREDGQAAYEVLETYKGKDLEYKEYEPLYQCA